MNKHITLVLCLLWAVFTGNAQCPGTPVTLTTQAQVDNFIIMYPTCTEVNVSITVNGNNITNLNGLSNLTSITKSLFVKDCPSLNNLTGLTNLSNIGNELTFDNCDALTSFNGLQNLPFIGGSLTITGNALLSNMSAFSNLDHINGTLLVSFNPLLTNLNGFENVATMGRFLQINNNNGLTSLSGLNSLTQVGNNAATVGRFLAITSNPNLTTLNGLHNLESVGTDFEITNNPVLATLDAFENLSTIGGIFAITGNPQLTSILDFASISSIGSSLTISNNNLLSDCEALGICNYLDGPGPAVISNNDPGCNTVAQVEAECAALPVKLISFEGKRVPTGVLLNWETAIELNNAYFQVEHSLDGRSFRSIGKVQGKGTAQSANVYQFEHRKPASGTNYYRLRQVDNDAKFEYSNMVGVFVGDALVVEISPNPTTGSLWVNVPGEEGPRARVIDLTGRVVLEKNLSESNLVDLLGQPKGVYFIEIQTDSQRVVKRVVME